MEAAIVHIRTVSEPVWLPRSGPVWVITPKRQYTGTVSEVARDMEADGWRVMFDA